MAHCAGHTVYCVCWHGVYGMMDSSTLCVTFSFWLRICSVDLLVDILYVVEWPMVLLLTENGFNFYDVNVMICYRDFRL